MKKFNTLLTASASYLILGSALAASPSAVNVTLFKTEVCNDTACTTILDNTTGVSAELVSGDGAFGDNPNVDAGSYNRFRFTLKNEILVSGTPDAPCSAVSNQQSLIDSSLASTNQVTISFATGNAATPGSTGWYANGTAAHPFFMSAPVVVEANGTTDVTVQFNTADTLNCVGGTASIDAPTFAVSSYVQPPATASNTFSGGNYWIVGTSMHSPWLVAEATYTAGQFGGGVWPTADIAQGMMIAPGVSSDGTPIYEYLLGSDQTPQYNAQIRGRTTREMRWGLKVNISAPDAAGVGTVSLVREEGHQRFAPVFDSGNESFQAAASVDATPVAAGTYQLDANNRLTLFITGSTPIQGALSDDYETLVVGDTSDGISMSMGVKVATGVTALPNTTYSWNSYSVELGRDDSIAQDGSLAVPANGNETLDLYYDGSIGWIDATTPASASMATIGAKQQIQDPNLTSAAFSTFQKDEGETAQDFSGFLAGFVDGAGMVGPQLENWLAVSPGGQVAIMTDAAEYDARYSDDAYVADGSTDAMHDFRVQKRSSFNILVQLADTGVHTIADLAGQYFLSGLWDNVSAGNSNFGGSVGEVTLNADGTASFNFTDVDNLNRVNSNSGTMSWDIINACIGVTGVKPAVQTRMDINDSTCTGGKIVDAIVGFDPALPDDHFVAIFPSADGKTITYFDPQSLDPSGATSRSLGLGVKLKP